LDSTRRFQTASAASCNPARKPMRGSGLGGPPPPGVGVVVVVVDDAHAVIKATPNASGSDNSRHFAIMANSFAGS
jgi:hypothetical protein